MTSYSNYQDLLFSHNFIGGAGKNQIPNSANDIRADVDKDVNDIYQFGAV